MLFTPKERANALILTVMTLIGSVCEALSIALVFPYINIIMQPKSLGAYPIIGSMVAGLSERRIILYASILLLIGFTVKNVYLMFMYYIQSRFVSRRQIVFRERLLRSYLYKPYDFYLTHNIAELQRNTTDSINNVINGVFSSIINMVCELFVSVLILGLLLYMNVVSTVIIIAVFAVIFLVIIKNQKRSISRHSQNAHFSYAEMLKWTNQSINAIKYVKVRENQEFFIDKVRKNGTSYADAAIYYNVLQQIPRLVIEMAAVFSLCVVIFYNLIVGHSFGDIIPLVTLFGASAYRLMPSLNRLISLYNTVRYTLPPFNEIFSDLYESKKTTAMRSVKREGEFIFQRAIEIKDISFSYNESNGNVLNHVTFTIPKGVKVGILGPSGEGKSTLLDIIMGLLTPQSGEILIDGRNINDCMPDWHALLSYIPQDTYLMDDTILNNITVGIPASDIDAIYTRKVLEMARIADFVDSLPSGWDTVVGDKGVRLSGGQRQRVAIARALYTKPQVLVLDEATSALDYETETGIVETLDDINRDAGITVIIVAHKDTMIAHCDSTYDLRADKG